jgi:hypothetical protein
MQQYKTLVRQINSKAFINKRVVDSVAIFEINSLRYIIISVILLWQVDSQNFPDSHRLRISNHTSKRSAIPSNSSTEMWYSSKVIQNNVEPAYYPLPREKPAAEVDQSRMLNPDYISTTHDHFQPKNVGIDVVQLHQPDWVRLDRHVLRFYGYFKEGVV